MKTNIQYTFAIAFFLTGVQFLSAQKKEENIGTEVVNVVKPYTPTISDAFKVKETPMLDDEDNTKKEPIKYSIFSFPVASTFTPSKGRAAGVDKTAQERLYKNYVTGGLGNYLTAFAELYVTENIGDNDYVAGSVKHLSSQGGIDEVRAKDSYMNTGLDLTYGSKQREFSWNADLGYQLQNYHWYGVPETYGLTFFTPEQVAGIYDKVNDGFVYNNFYVGGKIGFTESVFDEVSIKYNRFWDDYNSAENRFILKPSLRFDINQTTIHTNIIVDYVGGTFEKNSNFVTPPSYGYANFGIQPSFAMHKDDWSFNIGASLFYSLDTENSNNRFLVYPKINASLNIVGDLMVFYAGAEGGLDQNSYRDFTNENPFISPNVFAAPTDRQFDLFGGLKGKLSNYISYDLRGSFIRERDKPLFVSNPYDESQLEQEAYQYSNSFGVIYDDVSTIRFFGEVRADLSKNFSFGINGTYNSYDLKFQDEPWNLPSLKLGANLDVNITPKWYAGTNLFFVGQRKERITQISLLPAADIMTTVTLENYFDANAHVGYKYSDRFTMFLRLNNIANKLYEKWLNYKVQPFQVMIGGNYKFDF